MEVFGKVIIVAILKLLEKQTDIIQIVEDIKNINFICVNLKMEQQQKQKLVKLKLEKLEIQITPQYAGKDFQEKENGNFILIKKQLKNIEYFMGF